MKSSKFRMIPLPTDVAEKARRDAGNAVHRSPHCDCRFAQRLSVPALFALGKTGRTHDFVSLRAIPAGRPYSESGPIFVHAEPCERYAATDQFPADFRKGRVIRAYDSDQNIIAAEVVNGSEPEAIIEKFLQKPETAFVHVRSASHGCYTMKIERI